MDFDHDDESKEGSQDVGQWASEIEALRVCNTLQSRLVDQSRMIQNCRCSAEAPGSDECKARSAISRDNRAATYSTDVQLIVPCSLISVWRFHGSVCPQEELRVVTERRIGISG